MNAWSVLPLLVPLITTLACLALRDRPGAQRWASFTGAVLFLAVAGTLAVGTAKGVVYETRLGDWPEPFAIRLRIDALGAALLAVSGVVLVAVLLVPGRGESATASSPLLLPLVHGLMVGVGGAFSTADLFNLYVWFEVMLICALGLIALGRERRHLDAALRYLVLNSLGAVLLLCAVGGIYGISGSLDFGAAATGLGGSESASPAATALVALALLALLIKSAAFPFGAWLPAAYPVLPTPILALFAGLLTKVGAYAVLRLVAEIAPAAAAPLLEPLGWIAAATMLTGVLGAAYHQDLRRILSFHVISQIGYILLAISLGTRAAIAAALVYTIHHILVKANLFLISGLIRRSGGSFDLRHLGGLASRPALAFVFAIPAASLIGLPLTSGFWAKLTVVKLCFAEGRYVFGIVALLVGGLTLYSMTKVWIEAFWKEPPEPVYPRRLPAAAWWSTYSLAAITLVLGIHPEPLLEFAALAARLGPLELP